MELSKAQRCTQDFDHAEGQMVGQDSFSFLVFHLKTDNKSKTVSIKTEKIVSLPNRRKADQDEELEILVLCLLPALPFWDSDS